MTALSGFVFGWHCPWIADNVFIFFFTIYFLGVGLAGAGFSFGGP
jgi:hypothetical protein